MEVKKRLVILNVITSGAQVVFIGLSYFLLYRYLLAKLGVELLGVWSVVLSTSSLANLANFGVADSVIRFVALYAKEGDRNKMRELIFTASLFLLALFLLIACIIYPFADLILKHVLPVKFIHDGLLILPYSLLCLIINAVNGVFSSVLDGLQKNYIRSLFFSLSSLILLGATYLLVPHFGLQGVAFAQVGQSVFTIAVCLTCVIVQTAYNPLKWGWNRSVFKQIFNYGMKFQFISLANMLNEPVTKILLGKFGGMSFVGYYEMANRLLIQARGVIVNGTQSLVPVMVNLNEDVAEVQKFYKKIFSNTLFFSLAGTALIILVGRLVAVLWIGSYQPVFYYTLLILSCSLLVNLLITPSYFYYMAKANLNVLIRTHMLLGFANAGIGFLLGFFIGGYGVVFGWFAAVIIGSLYIMQYFGKNFHIKMQDLSRRSDLYFGLALFVIVIFDVTNLIKADFKTIDLFSLIVAIAVISYYFFKFKIADIRNR